MAPTTSEVEQGIEEIKVRLSGDIQELEHRLDPALRVGRWVSAHRILLTVMVAGVFALVEARKLTR